MPVVERSKPVFPFSAAAKAAEIPLGNFRNWIARGHVTFGGDGFAEAESWGQPNLVDFATVVQMAIMGKLTKLGIRPERAWGYTTVYSDMGEPTFPGDPAPQRLPGELFKTGETCLIITEGEHAQVISADRHMPLAGLLGQPAAIVVHINSIERRVEETLEKLGKKW